MSLSSTEELDAELVALAKPPSAARVRAIAAMLFTVVFAIALGAHLRRDVAYFFAGGQPRALGEASAVRQADLIANSYATIHGSPMASSVVFFDRPLGGGHYALFPLAGQRNVYVQLPVASETAFANSAASEFSGRLVPFEALGARADSLLEALRDNGMPATESSFVLLAEEPPGSYLWAVVLGALCLFAVGLNAGLLFWWFAPLGAPAWKLAQTKQ